MGGTTSSTNIPELQDLVSVAVVWYAETFGGILPTEHGRVAEGSLLLKTPTSMLQWYSEFETIFNYADRPEFYSPITFQFIFLVVCSIHNQSITAKCYDNVFADVALQNGIYPRGIYGYFDMFTWYGMSKVLLFTSIYWVAKYLLFNTLSVLAMGLYMSFTPDLVFCNNGEWDLWGWDVCKEVFGGDEGYGFVEFFESDEKTGIPMQIKP